MYLLPVIGKECNEEFSQQLFYQGKEKPVSI